MSETPRLRWFEAYSPCRICGGKSAGLLRGVSNESYGDHCKKCADRRLKLSAAIRDAEKAREARSALAKAQGAQS